MSRSDDLVFSNSSRPADSRWTYKPAGGSNVAKLS